MLKPIDPQRCPVDQALELIAGKWKPLILWRLTGGTFRFSQLQRAIPAVTQRMLTLQLRELERDGLVVRTVHAEVPPRVEYSLTPPARALMPSLATLGEWLLSFHAQLDAPATPRSVAFADSLDAGADVTTRGIRRIRMPRAPRLRLSA
jgi:DNA-binding HxlR family transcriptional regulator